MTVAHPKASCEGCAAEENKGTKYKRSGREKLCEALSPVVIIAFGRKSDG